MAITKSDIKREQLREAIGVLMTTESEVIVKKAVQKLSRNGLTKDQISGLLKKRFN